MARIRSIHPGIFTDETYMSLTFPARELIKGLWCEADDHGVFEWKPLTIKARIMPADAVDVPALMEELVGAKFVSKYAIEGKLFGAIRNFCKYQRPKKPSFVHPLPNRLRDWVAIKGEAVAVNGNESVTGGEPVGNQAGTGGGKSPQMEEGGGTKEEENSSPRNSAGTSRGASADPAMVVVKAFMAERRSRWPEAPLANHLATQAEHAKTLLSLPGATVELVCDLLKAGVAEWKDPIPPGGVGALKNSVTNQVARHVRAGAHPASRPAAQQTHTPNVVVIDRNSTMRARLESYKADGKWPYGDPEPTSPFCQIDRRLMLEVMGEEFMRRHHAPPTVYPQAPAVSAAH